MGEADWWGALPRSADRCWAKKLFGRAVKLATIADTREYKSTKVRVQASVSRAVSAVAYDVLSAGSNLLQLASIPALNIASSVLLSIWDAVDLIETNQTACLHLTERCSEFLIAICAEVHRAGPRAVSELRQPLEKLEDVFEEVHASLVRQSRRSFLQRYLKRDEFQRDISHCESSIDDAISLFLITIQIRTLSLVQESESRRGEDTWNRESALYSSSQLSFSNVHEWDPTSSSRGSQFNDMRSESSLPWSQTIPSPTPAMDHAPGSPSQISLDLHEWDSTSRSSQFDDMRSESSIPWSQTIPSPTTSMDYALQPPHSAVETQLWDPLLYILLHQMSTFESSHTPFAPVHGDLQYLGFFSEETQAPWDQRDLRGPPEPVTQRRRSNRAIRRANQHRSNQAPYQSR
ncbi:hypothetical protein PENSPDRAFT_688706 [Peniophora sp. CONT]|nr:hypothetical protein PENSPDRAFT_688706 [Peniophora sp. CONT]